LSLAAIQFPEKAQQMYAASAVSDERKSGPLPPEKRRRPDMAKKPVHIESEDILLLSVTRALMEAGLEGNDREYFPMRDLLYKEGFGFHLTNCLLEMKHEDFKRLNFLLTDLKAVLAREQSKAADTEAVVTPLDEETTEISSTDQVKMLFSNRPENCSYTTFEKHVKSSLRQILEKSKREGAEDRKKDIAWRMQCLGFPLHTILRVTGYTPEIKDTDDSKSVWR